MSDKKSVTPGVPYHGQPSFRCKCREVGINMDAFVDLLALDKTNMELAAESGVREEVARQLKEEFVKYGINSGETKN